DTGEGTGLGLAVANGIVKDHDGWIEVDDRPQGGALFRVFLPVAHFAAGEATHDGSAPPENLDADTRRSDRELVPVAGIGKHENAGRGDA
ncbi:MAG TPA: ATP-binding protein, partial [Polyangia bacterium]